MSLMGPSLGGDPWTTYNVYLGDVAPLQMFYSATLGYEPIPEIEFGITGSATNNISGPVTGITGNIYTPNFVFFDPGIYLKFPKLIQIPGWYVTTTVSFLFPLTDASQEIGRVLSFTFNQNWGIDLNPSNWTFGCTLFLNPQFYAGELPAGFGYRQTFVGALGPYLGYRLSDYVTVQASTVFDFDHRSPDQPGWLELGPNLDDRARLSVSVTPNVYPYYMAIGGYFQMLLDDPSWDTSIVGADFTIGF